MLPENYQKLVARINVLGEEVVNAPMSAWEKQRKEDELVDLLLEMKHLGRLKKSYSKIGVLSSSPKNENAEEDSEATTAEASAPVLLEEGSEEANIPAQLFEHIRGANEYSGIIFTETYNFVMEHYGEPNEKTGEIEPFAMLFNKMYKIKAQGLHEEQLNHTEGMDQAAKRKALRSFLKEEAARNGLSLDKTDFNILNADKLKEYMKKAGFGPLSLKRAVGIIEGCSVTGDVVAKDEEEGEMSLYDQAVAKEYDMTNNVLSNLYKRFYSSLAKVKGKKDAKYMKYWITYNCFQNPDGFKAAFSTMAPLIDKEFWSFLEANPGFDKPADALECFTKRQRPTVQKSLAKTKAFFAVARPKQKQAPKASDQKSCAKVKAAVQKPQPSKEANTKEAMSEIRS